MRLWCGRARGGIGICACLELAPFGFVAMACAGGQVPWGNANRGSEVIAKEGAYWRHRPMPGRAGHSDQRKRTPAGGPGEGVLFYGRFQCGCHPHAHAHRPHRAPAARGRSVRSRGACAYGCLGGAGRRRGDSQHAQMHGRSVLLFFITASYMDAFL